MNFPTSSKSILIIKGLIKQNKCKLSCAGYSMLPLFQPGEIINIEPLKHQMKIGDVVLYYKRRHGLLSNIASHSLYHKKICRG